ncbi:hypothetical protein OIO90_001352 [Microbotryomycetes sp. JL221]|nr:hypothetical protein OIO90_001352 [Microbotryomycetes sp. JL221]
MYSQGVREELVLLRSMLVDGEFDWELEPDDVKRVEGALQDEQMKDELGRDLPAPEFSLRLADGVELAVAYSKQQDDLPRIVLHAATIPKPEQAALVSEVDRQLATIADEGAQFPVFSLYTAMQDYLVEHPIRSKESEEAKPDVQISRSVTAPDLRLKVVLFWSHHLLATGKRKNIVQWASELKLWGISKPGYPGVWVVEGLVADVDEFVFRIKQLNWKALQVRCEIEGNQVSKPSGNTPAEQIDWALRTQTHLASVLEGGTNDKIGVREVEGLDELGTLMGQAGLADVFRTALKL